MERQKSCCFIDGVIVDDYKILDNFMYDEFLKLIKDGYNTFYCEIYGDFAKICRNLVNELQISFPFIELRKVRVIDDEILKRCEQIYWCTDGGIKNPSLDKLFGLIVKNKKVSFVSSYFKPVRKIN